MGRPPLKRHPSSGPGNSRKELTAVRSTSGVDPRLNQQGLDTEARMTSTEDEASKEPADRRARHPEHDR